MGTAYYHGGRRGLKVGDLLVPSHPHVVDGCPICIARAAGIAMTVGEFKEWLRQTVPPERARPILELLADADDDELIDPPSRREAVYMTTDIRYARWYAARSRGDLYRVQPVGRVERSEEDPAESYTAPAARIVEVIERRVVLRRRDRRELMRAWEKADRGAMAARNPNNNPNRVMAEMRVGPAA